MLRVTPIYGSRYNVYGEAEEPTCTLIEFSNCRCIFNVGYNGSYWNNIILNQSTMDTSVNSKVLVDNDQQQQQKEKEVLKFPDHDCVFIMNSTWQCVGGLPIYYDYMVQQYNAGIITSVPPIYTTYPTIKMGLMTLYDYHASIAMDGLNPPFTLASIDNVFTSMNAIKFNQHIYITPQSNLLLEQSTTTTTTTTTTTSSTGTTGTITSPQLSVTAHRAGYVVGAAYFVIQRLMDETTVIYTDSTYHMSKELHLEACTLLSQSSITNLPDIFITRPGGPSFRQFRALVTNQQSNTNNNSSNGTTNSKNQSKQSAAAAAILQQPLVQQAERNLIENIMSVLRRDGNVLLPVDTSGRILEIALLLHLEWDKQKYYNTYNLICYSQMCYNVFDYAKSQLEWMSQQLNAQFADHGQHPYRFGSNQRNKSMNRTIQFCTSIHELNTILMDNQNPSCIIASGLSLEGGPSRDVLLKFADNPDNAIFFTDSSQCYLRRTYYDNSNSSYTNSTKVSDKHRTTNNNSTDSYTNHGNMLSSIVPPSTSVPNNEHLDSDGIITLTDDDITRTTDIVSPTAPSLVGTSIDNATNEEDVDDDVTNIGEALTGDNKSIWTTAGQLLQAWATAKALGTEMADVVVVDVNVPIRAPLSGNELKIFLEQEEQKRQAYIKAAEKRAMLAQVELAKGQLRLSEDDNVPTTTTTTSSSVLTKDAQQVTSTMKTKSTRPKKKSRFDSTLFLKFSKPLYMTFDIREEAVGLGQPDSIAKYGIGESVGRSGEVLEDDYGISVQHERFTDIVSGVDPSKFAAGSGRIGDDLVRRGFGYDSNNIAHGKPKSSSTTPSNSSRVVSDIDENDDDVDIMNEQVQEALDLSEGTGIIRGRNGRSPTKVSTVTRRLEVLAEVSYIPGLEGRVDARAARQSVRALQPRDVIVLGGTRKESDGLDHNNPTSRNLMSDEVRLFADVAKTFVKGSKGVWTPTDGETVALDVGHAAYSVRLIDKPYVSTNTMDVDIDSPEVPESIEPHETKLGVCNVSLIDCVATGQKVALDGSIVLAPQLPSRVKDSPSIYLSDGDILLTQLRAELIALGMKAEYSAHTGYSQLVVNGKIMLKKEQSQDSIGRMSIEGPLCEDFYKVRSIMSGKFIVL